MTAEPVYLYGGGKTKHIADPDATDGHGRGEAVSYCRHWLGTEERTLARLTTWGGKESALKQMERRRRLPLCKHCEKAHLTAVSE